MHNIIRTHKTNVLVVSVLIAFIVLSYSCYGYIGLRPYNRWMSIISLVLLFYMGISSIEKIRYFKKYFFFELLILLCCLITACFAMAEEGITTFPYYTHYLSLVMIPFLIKNKPRLNTLEIVLVTLALVYLMCWLYQISKVPEIVMGTSLNSSTGSDSRGFYRFYIQTKEHFPFLLFYLLALYNRKKNLLYLLLALPVFVVIILHVSRQIIFWSAAMACLYYVVVNRKFMKLGLFVIVISVFGYYIVSKIEAVSILYELTTSSNDFNSADLENIRFKGMAHYIDHYNNTPFSFMFGSGFPKSGSIYSRQLNYSMQQGFYLSDVGYVAMYVHFGIVAIILYAILVLNYLIRLRVPTKYLYLKFYIAYLALSHFGGHSLTSNLIFFCIALYILKASSILKHSETHL